MLNLFLPYWVIQDGDFSSEFDEIIESSIIDTTLKDLLIINPLLQANKAKVFGQLALEHLFGFLIPLEK